MARTHAPAGPTEQPACPTDVVVWHGLMAAWMAVMLATSLAGRHQAAALGRYDAVALGVFMAGTAWAVSRLAAGHGRPAYLRLGVCCAAMVAMLVPAATAAAEPRPTSVMSGMPGMAAPATTAATPLGPPVLVSLLLVLALLVVVGSQVAALRAQPAAHPLARGLEVGTAGAMAVMLGLAL